MARNDHDSYLWPTIAMLMQFLALPCMLSALVCLASAVAAGSTDKSLGYGIGGVAAVAFCSAAISAVFTITNRPRPVQRQ